MVTEKLEIEAKYLKFGQNSIEITKVLIEAMGICLNYLKPEDIAKIKKQMDISPNVFLLGAGRSGLTIKAFGMRVAQMKILGKNIYIAGETTTPAPIEGDFALVASSSGESAVNLATQYKAYGAKLGLLGAHRESAIGTMAGDLFIHIADKNQILIDYPEFAARIKTIKNWAPLGTIPEIFALVLLDAIISEWMNELNMDDSKLKRGHQIY